MLPGYPDLSSIVLQNSVRVYNKSISTTIMQTAKWPAHHGVWNRYSCKVRQRHSIEKYKQKERDDKGAADNFTRKRNLS